MSPTGAALQAGIVRLGELWVSPVPAFDSRAAGIAQVDYYSMDAFARGLADALPVAAIGAGAQCVQPGDVLISCAAQMPRRAWVVADRGRPQVASADWLVLRSPRHDPTYLRHILVSNEFRLRFTRAVASARGAPARIAAIDLPQPSLARQRAAARILDHADALRAKRRSSLATLDRLAPALFHGRNRVLPSAAERAALDALSTRLDASRRALDALIAVLRDGAFRRDALLLGGDDGGERAGC
ncbi:MAG: hypothetical protein IT531_04660 [Burkholderiales bacterium]|nr:hypothetical protein [Burkholderiales bacterium]